MKRFIGYAVFFLLSSCASKNITTEHVAISAGSSATRKIAQVEEAKMRVVDLGRTWDRNFAPNSGRGVEKTSCLYGLELVGACEGPCDEITYVNTTNYRTSCIIEIYSSLSSIDAKIKKLEENNKAYLGAELSRIRNDIAKDEQLVDEIAKKVNKRQDKK